MMNILFFINSILLGIGLAMDAFSVSMANGLNEPNMSRNRMISISSIFGIFQAIMPLLGWFFIRFLLEFFTSFEKFIPWIALILLLYIGGKMLIDGIKGDADEEKPALSLATLMVQGVATSIDALSVGFTIAEYPFYVALIECLIIGLVTSIVCYVGTIIGKKAGTKLANKATILGGIILIVIGIEIFVMGVF